MQDCYERYRISDYKDPSDAILHSVISQIDYKVYFHRHTYYEIFLVYSGGMLHEVNHKSVEVPANTILFIRPDDYHRYRQTGGNPCGLVRLWVSQEIITGLMGFLGGTVNLQGLLTETLPPSAVLPQSKMEEFVERFEAVFSFHQEEENRRIACLKQLLLELIYLFTGVMNQQHDSSLPLWLAELCSQISVRDNFLGGLDKLFELSPVSREHLSRSFQKYLGTTPTRYINRLRLNYAANQLANTNRRIIDICYDSGFGNLSHFYQCFESQYGTTPKDYRFEKMTPAVLD